LLHAGLREAAARYGIVAEVRGRGLMLAIELVEPGTLTPNVIATGRVFEECREAGLLVGRGGLYGNVIRMGPPLTLTEAEAKEGLDILVAALATADAGAGR
jgi:4-aminobutyrate aminotransferase